MYEKLDLVTKASLLHDLGRIVLRSETVHKDSKGAGCEFLKNSNFQMDGIDELLTCMEYENPEELRNSQFDENHIAYLIHEAGNIASGIDGHSDHLHETSEDFEKSMPLFSVFNHMNKHKNEKCEGFKPGLYFETNEIRMPSDIQELNNKNHETDLYKQILSRIKEGLEKGPEYANSINYLLKLMESTTSGIPSTAREGMAPDSSIFTHSKMMCAIATCMYIHSEYYGIRDYRAQFLNSAEFRKQKNFLLVSGEFSGIQDFIYTISSKGALKSLRGRSLYLEMFTECIIDDLLDQCGLSRANLIYSGGGHFYILLPNTDQIVDILKETKKNINKELLDMFAISLYFEMAYQECSPEELGNGFQEKGKDNLLGNLYIELSRKISRGKLQRYQDHDLELLFSPDSTINRKNQHERECVICGESNNLVTFQSNKDVLSCFNCNQLAELGKKIVSIRGNESRYLLTTSSNGDKGLAIPTGRGKKYLNLEERSVVKEALKSNAAAYWNTYSINGILLDDVQAINLWIGNYNKRLEANQSIDFENLVAVSKGIKRLGVFRADVDDLGQAFTRGFENRNDQEHPYNFITFARSAAFSREMNLFFKHELNKLCDGSADGQFSFRLPGNDKGLKGNEKNIVIVYSGGDDVFALGPWDEIIEFAVNLRNAFRQFSMDRLSLSAGIGLFDEGYPISRMAYETGELEVVAKGNQLGKNSIALFDCNSKDNRSVFTWDEFIDSVCQDKMNKLHRWFAFENSEDKKDKSKLSGSTSLLYKLHHLFLNSDSINIARLAYLIGRIKPEESSSEKAALYNEMKTDLYKWALDEKSRKEAAMAINLIILSERSELSE